MGGDITTPYKKFGNWLARSLATVYQAETDGIVCACGKIDADMIGFTDGSNPPTTERIKCSSPGTQYPGITMPVRKNDYWKVTAVVGVDALWWIPLEP